MKIQELKRRIQETLNLEVITKDSLITCINNGFADLHSRGYVYHDEETFYDFDPNEETKVELPKELRSVSYVKVITERGAVDIDRINLGDKRYLGKESDVDFKGTDVMFLYFVIGNQVHIRKRFNNSIIKQVIIGYQKKLKPLSFDVDLDEELPVREELLDALVFYGVYFYGKRTNLEPELIKDDLDRYRYHVQDMLTDLAREDEYYEGVQTIGEGFIDG